MTKTKVDTGSPTHFVSSKEKRQKQKMESSTGEQEQPQPSQQQPAQPLQVTEKKKIPRAPSPARPKDVPGWSLTKIRGGIGTPTLSVKPGAIYLGGRVSRRSPVTGKETKTEKSKPTGKPALSAPGAQKSSVKSNKSGRRKASDASIGLDDLSKDSGCAPGKLSPTDSSSELSDCASEENKVSTDALSSDIETSSRGGIDGEKAAAEHGLLDKSGQTKTSLEKDRLSLGMETAEGSVSPGDERSLTSFDSRMPASTSLAFSDLTEELMAGMHEELIREIEELRSENDYLKDEMEELRSEMLEMRDMYMEEDVYQLQELRQQLDQANKTCRILQYRLKKAERRSIRVAQTGQVDGELIRTLEQDVKVSKDVSIRLHNELDAVEKKRSRLEQENEELRVKLQDLEVAKQVLQAEMEKARENSLKKRGARPNNKPDKKASPQPPEDSSDLKCQLHFAKEESVLMCKKLTKMVKDNEAMREELAKYCSLYGEVDASLTVEEVADSPHTREAEVKVHLKLVEEEANLLSRRIVELEVENRGLRAEMDDMKIHDSPGGVGVMGGVGSHLLLSTSENVMELQRHLQFVEEEADLLRRSLIEMEEQNKLLMNELNHYKSELPTVTEIELSSSTTITSPTIIPGASEDGGSGLNEASHKELLAARLQITELNGKVKKLQYENRVLLSNLQRCDLASNQGSARPALETDAEAGDSAECLPIQAHREGPVGDEQNDILEEKNLKVSGTSHTHTAQCLSIKDLLAIRDQAQLVTSAIQLLMSPDPSCISPDTVYHKIMTNESAEPFLLEKSQTQSSTLPLVEVLHGRLQSLQAQLQALSERVDALGQPPERERVEGMSLMPLLSDAEDPAANCSCPADAQFNQNTNQQKPDSRDQPDCEVKVHSCKAEEESNSHKDSNKEDEYDLKETNSDLLTEQVGELLALLSEAREKAQGAQEALSQERQARHNDTHKLSQLQEEHQKALLRRDFQLQSLSLQTRLQQKLWSQERNLLVQESQQLKESLLLISLKLRWLLKQWRLGTKLDTESKDILEVNSVKDLRILLEEDGLSSHYGDNKMSAAEEQPLNATPKEHSLAEKSCLQPSGFGSTVSDLKVVLQDLSAELREECQSSQELTQQFARAKASWEVERLELKSIITALEGKMGKPSVAGGEKDSPDLKGALKKEREEHQHLLADSYAAVMDLTKQLQISEKNWSRERLELLEHFNQERSQWEQHLRDIQSKGTQSLHDKTSEREISADAATSCSGLQRTKSISSLSEFKSMLDTSLFLPGHKVSGVPECNVAQHQSTAPASILARTDLSDLNKKNWKYLTNDSAMLEKGDQFKTWDCPSTNSNSSFPGLELSKEYIQRSYTAPDKTGIRIYYSPPTVRRMERRPVKEKAQQDPQQGPSSWDGAMIDPSGQIAASAPLSTTSSSSYEQWLSSLSQQHRDLLEGRTGGSAPFHGLEISGNLSDDMKEMTNCVRQAIRSSSLERKCSKDTGSQTVGVSSTGTQTAQFVSIGLQTDGPISTTRCPQGKAWSSRPSTSLSSARTRQISSSLEKVHSRIDRPCCSPKYGSPKLTRRVSTSSSKLETSSTSSRDRSVWNLHNRSGSQNGSAWARSTTTRDSPVLSGLNDGLTSLFSVVEHSGSVESLWKADTFLGRQAAGKPSCPSIGISLGEAGAQKYGMVQEFLRNVCGRTAPAGTIDEPKPEYLPGALIGTDNITKIVNKRFMKTQRDEFVATGKDAMSSCSSTLEDSLCDCSSQTVTSCFARHSRSTTRHTHSQCKHRVQESPMGTEERFDTSNE
ncbi:protein SOGA1-like isoform X2 [Sinocyclocheilus anshuiensis]|uniref:protein SOGA1-like isoform X2 n=1 Tax=Sinocyclocheilus anshuiensis TaxID=1608454 RepID=UPI0007B87261|nr:PREDICTED: protein SOGA1-like isoform X2 [Sinocyclocheilus anshuiensis]